MMAFKAWPWHCPPHHARTHQNATETCYNTPGARENAQEPRESTRRDHNPTRRRNNAVTTPTRALSRTQLRFARANETKRFVITSYSIHYTKLYDDYDCREGICGQCGCVVNGRPHGPEKATTLCQLHMRHFSDGDTRNNFV